MAERTYPKNRESFTWANLRHLARSLGFQDHLFEKRLPCEHRKGDGLDDHVLHFLIDVKTFDASLHRTANMQGAEYNNKVLKKAVQALRARQISFEELNDARVAFFCYEEHDMVGMLIDEASLLKALKMCKRIVSPLYLMSEVRRLELDFPGRIQLYEFLDLFKISQPEDSVETKDSSSVLDFEDLLQTTDEKKMAILDKEYQQSVYKPRKEKPLVFRKPLEGSVVNKDLRREQRANARRTAQPLMRNVRKSNYSVVRTRCGGARGERSGEEDLDPGRRNVGSRPKNDDRMQEPISRSEFSETPPLRDWHADPIVTDTERHAQEVLIQRKRWEMMLNERKQ
ncbi:uncharacterized protein [Oscarella lobularis]|uniref:uncharacterized protein isoform X1 n=1 Tax=Oscarella lobularis TaxID=121494 RepID=UPI0033130EC4